MSLKENTTLYEALPAWLADYGTTEQEIRSDDNGRFIEVETDNGNPEEDGYTVRVEKVYLPKEFQELCLN